MSTSLTKKELKEILIKEKVINSFGEYNKEYFDNDLETLPLYKRLIALIIDFSTVIIPLRIIFFNLNTNSDGMTQKEKIMKEFEQYGVTESDLDMVSGMFPELENLTTQMIWFKIYIPTLHEIGIAAIFFILLWWITGGRSLGLYITGGKIVKENDQRLDLWSSVKRGFGNIISITLTMGIASLPVLKKASRSYPEIFSSTKIVSFRDFQKEKYLSIH